MKRRARPVDTGRVNKMMQTVWAVIHDGRIEPSEPVELPEGARVLVTLLPEMDEKAILVGSQRKIAFRDLGQRRG